MSKPLSKEERAAIINGTRDYHQHHPNYVRYEATVSDLEQRLANAEADVEMWEQSAKEHMGLCVKLEKRLAEVTNSDDRDAQVMQKNRAIRDLEQRLAVAVEALKDVREMATIDGYASWDDVDMACGDALSRIGAGKEGE